MIERGFFGKRLICFVEITTNGFDILIGWLSFPWLSDVGWVYIFLFIVTVWVDFFDVIGLKGDIVIFLLFCNWICFCVILSFSGLCVCLRNVFIGGLVKAHFVAETDFCWNFYLGVGFGLKMTAVYPISIERVLIGFHIFRCFWLT